MHFRKNQNECQLAKFESLEDLGTIKFLLIFKCLIFLLRVSGPEPGIDDRLFAFDFQGEEICLFLEIKK
jgi:hypothetical protein